MQIISCNKGENHMLGCEYKLEDEISNPEECNEIYLSSSSKCYNIHDVVGTI